MNSFLTPEHEVTLDLGYVHSHVPQVHHYGAASVRLSTVRWPPAQEHPFFYIGIYAPISLGAVLVNVTGVITQYTGALRASRILFHRLLNAVVRATMRWHDTTPQGQCLDASTMSKRLRLYRSNAESFQQGTISSIFQLAASLTICIGRRDCGHLSR